MLGLVNRGKYSRSVEAEFEHLIGRLRTLLAQIFDEDGNLILLDTTVVEEGAIDIIGIADNSLGLEKLETVNPSTLLGRQSSSAGNVQSISLAASLSMSGTTLYGPKPFLVFLPDDNQPPAAAAATQSTRNARDMLQFDGNSDEEAVFTSVLPLSYASGGLTCDLYVAFTSATSGSVRFQAAIERIDVSNLDLDADSFTSFQSAGGTAPGTSGQVIKVSIPFTSGAQMDSLVAGELFRLKIRRDADGTSGTDDITTDAEVYAVVVRET